MLERGQGLYFTPKRARKFKVEAVCNLSPGPQQGMDVDVVPQPHMREPCCHWASVGNRGSLPPRDRERWLPALAQVLATLCSLPKGDTQDNPSASHGKQVGLKFPQFIKYPTAYLCWRGMADFEEGKSIILFGKFSLDILGHNSARKG